tara:strand:+ start:6679 stop:7575 length:897 start_codon:yes stop_codon:yes gene_type:complete
MIFHKPVLLEECITGLNIKSSGIYVDATFGGGGHSKSIIKKIQKGKVYAFDQDQDANINTPTSNCFKLINSNFRYLKQFLKLEGVEKIDGLLADLGVSSFQIDQAERGFSIRNKAELDMRMNQNSLLTALNIINDYSENDLADIFYRYGDLTNSRNIASEIVKVRSEKKIITTTDLIETVSHLTIYKKRNQFLARIFQAIRIEVNDEISALKEMLDSAVEMLNKHGRIVVISYHSLEDRIVKNLFKRGNTSGVLNKDLYGNVDRSLRQINKNVIRPTEKEIILNKRSRSAKLRIAEKI